MDGCIKYPRGMRGASAFVDTGKTPAARFSQGFLPCPVLGFSIWRWRIPGHEVMEGCCGRGRLDGPQREQGKEPPAQRLQGGQDWQPSPPALPVNDFDLLHIRHSRLFPSL